MCMEEEEKKNNAKFSGHYFHQRTHNVRAHSLRSDQKEEWSKWLRIWKQSAKGETKYIQEKNVKHA